MNNRFLVAIDLDGTLLRDDKTISETTKNYLKEFESAGNFVVLASGRPIGSMINYYNEMHLTSPFIAYNGSYISRCEKLNLKERDFLMDKEIVKKFYRDNIGKTICLMLCEGKNYFYYDSPDDNLFEFFASHDVEKIYGNMNDILNENVFNAVVKIKEPYNESRRLLSEYFKNNKDYNFRFWSNSNMGELYLRRVTKGHDLQILTEICRVLPQNVIVFGDAENDVEMFEMFENSFLMKNGWQDIRHKSKYVTKKDNNNDGVISSLQDFFNNNL